MSYLSTLRHSATIYRRRASSATDTARDGWGQDSRNPVANFAETRTGAIKCYHTDTDGTEQVAVGRTMRIVNVEVSIQISDDVRGDDRLILDDGRIVEVLAVRQIGNHHKIAKCANDSAKQKL